MSASDAFAMIPASWKLECRVDGRRRLLEVPGLEPYVTQDFSMLASYDGEVLRFELTPTAPLAVESFEVRLGHSYAADEMVLLNGYQSWTTTAELPAAAKMRGLGHVPKKIVDHYAIDGIGDYRFVDYGSGRGRQHGFSYGVFRRGDEHLLVGSLDERRGFTLVRTDVPAGEVSLKTECPLGALEPGVPVVLGEYVLLKGGKDRVYDRWFELMGVQARTVRPLVGYSSWYRHYGDIDRRKLEEDLAGARDAFEGLSTGAAVRLFQIDDGYCKVGDWLQVDEAKFPGGLAPLADAVRAAGFLPGLWMAPFVCERDSLLFARHQDWLLRDEAGRRVRTGPHWSGAFALDSRNPQVCDHVRESLGTAVREWGFGLLKLDFLYAACMVPHDGLNRGQLMADAMALVREAVGEDCLLLGCGVPLASAFGIVDYCRIGCDVGLDWDDKPHMRLLHRERVSTKNSLRNTVARAPLDGRAFANDPDVFFMRDDVKIGPARRRQLLETDARFGSVLLTSDDMGKWGSAERKAFQAAVRTMLERP